MEAHHEDSGHEEESGPASSVVGRTFRYMRRIPTIIEYKPPDHGMHSYLALSNNRAKIYYAKVDYRHPTPPSE